MSSEDTQNDKQGESGLSQFLSFTLGDDDYGIDILRVQEIRGWEEVRKIPHTPEYIKGVVNLRSVVVPIIDMRIRFGQEKYDYNPTTVIIVISVIYNENSHLLGIVVDSVSDVIDIDNSQIKPPPALGTNVNTEFMSGMFMVDERMIIVLDSDKLIDPDEIIAIENIVE